MATWACAKTGCKVKAATAANTTVLRIKGLIPVSPWSKTCERLTLRLPYKSLTNKYLYQSSQLLTLMAGFHELAGVILLTT
jgi:hypothetical protein